MNPKFWGMLSLAMRAGRLAVGEAKVTDAVRDGKAQLLLLAEDAGPNTEIKVLDMSVYRRIPILRPGDRRELGKAIGREFVVVLAVTDTGFSSQLSTLFENN